MPFLRNHPCLHDKAQIPDTERCTEGLSREGVPACDAHWTSFLRCQCSAFDTLYRGLTLNPLSAAFSAACVYDLNTLCLAKKEASPKYEGSMLNAAACERNCI